MKEIFIKDLRKDQEVTEFFMVKASAIKTGANGKQYLDITLGDKTGEVSGKNGMSARANIRSGRDQRKGYRENKRYRNRMGRTAANSCAADSPSQ